MTTTPEPSKAVGVAVAIAFLVLTACLLVLALGSSLWWLLPAFPAGLFGVVGLATELSRPGDQNGATRS